MSIYFITGNLGKLAEVKAIIPEVEQLDIDLPEIQELDPQAVIEEKLRSAQASHQGCFIVEDTSLYFAVLNGFPGPLIKWFLKSLGTQGIYDLLAKNGNLRAEAKTMIGYIDEAGQCHYFEGSIKGKIVEPRGSNGFGWDDIFEPDGFKQTFAEMSAVEKNQVSMRQQAALKLAAFLKK